MLKLASLVTVTPPVPVSVLLLNATVGAGAVWSSVKSIDAVALLPARSVSVTVTVCAPSVSAVAS